MGDATTERAPVARRFLGGGDGRRLARVTSPTLAQRWREVSSDRQAHTVVGIPGPKGGDEYGDSSGLPAETTVGSASSPGRDMY